jgi:hypothetical protein
MLKELAALLSELFATDQSYHLQQMKDGKYKKTAGSITPSLIELSLKKCGSIGSYQKNIDLSIKWICFDFDILKVNLESKFRESAQAELEVTVEKFCLSLDALCIPYLIEFSGNRGFHVWITLKEKINYRTGYEIRQTLFDEIGLSFNSSLIGIDFFPSSGLISDGVGKGVKLPLSKHTKTNEYSFLLRSPSEIRTMSRINTLDEAAISSNTEILRSHKSISKLELENALNVIFENHNEEVSSPRIKNIKVQNGGFSIEELIGHWKDYAPLKELSNNIFVTGNISHDERKILVGILCNVFKKDKKKFGHEILHEIFQKAKNYDADITNRQITKLASFSFPTQEQIENVTKIKFSTPLSTEDLLRACIPKFVEYSDGTFEISKSDIEIVRTAELTYVFLNDEAQSKLIINDLSSGDSSSLFNRVQDLMLYPKSAQFYKHARNEGQKIRTLVTLKAPERLLTSFILKQLVYLFDNQTSGNSHGYKPNKGFRGGYIFQPWLYLWIKFVSNISEAIEDSENKEFYIVKTDIKSFYDSIPHDNLKRHLLGDAAPRISEKLSLLTSESRATYKAHIDTIFEITGKITESKIGLPQGPAYARYLAEIYLDGIDTKFDKKVQDGSIRLYQRYVDDIFFIANTEEKAKSELNFLSDELGLLGLKINNEKTIITKIGNFSDDFNEYRSQSKYAVDRASKNFSDATETQQNLAIGEFINLVESDSCDQDLAFIFSHLDGVKQVEALKRQKVESTLRARSGRGSLYKHLFNFILESLENWSELYKIESFDILQSEVLTSCLINAFESNPQFATELKTLIFDLQGKISRSAFSSENLAYLVLVYGVEIDVKSISPETFISCLKSLTSLECIQGIHATNSLIEHLNTTLNEIKILSDFVESIYPLCASSKTSKNDLNNLASTFYAKMSSSQMNNTFSVDSPPEINTPSAASKLYYLLCLFSISNRNSSLDLLKSIWKYCAHVFNECDTDIAYKAPDWFRKISEVEYNQENALFIMSTIVDGNIFRGFYDRRKIFEKFHNLFLIFISFEDIEIDHEKLDIELNKLRSKADFYKWLTDLEKPNLFPVSNRAWFERNLIDNSLIILKKENLTLIRRPTNHFHPASSPFNELNGYSEIIVNYDAGSLYSVNDLLAGKALGERLKNLVEIINACESKTMYPNIFCRERMLDIATGAPFTLELTNSKMLFFENRNGTIESLENNQDNFIKCYFRVASNNGASLLPIKEKYIDNLNEGISIIGFVKGLSSSLEEIGNIEDEFHMDISAAAAMYSEIDDVDIVKKLDRFVNQYHKFNKEDADKHIYAVNNQMQIADGNPAELLATLGDSMSIIPNEVVCSLALYLHKDVDLYRGRLVKLLGDLDLEVSMFKRAYPVDRITTETLSLDGREYDFKDVNLVNLTTGEVVSLEIRNVIAIRSSEHVYVKDLNGTLYVIAIHSSISKMYRSIKTRKQLLVSANRTQSYPPTIFDKSVIISLNKFDLAVDVIHQHREVSKIDASKILIDWLSGLPKKFHQPFTTLIAAHITMNPSDIESFMLTVRRLLGEDDSNPFLIKRIEDHNGTHRILIRDPELGRRLELLSPLQLKDDSKRATIIVDNIISGSQIINSLKYYTGRITLNPNANHFTVPEQDRDRLSKNLHGLEQIDICTVLYTQQALSNIKSALSDLINSSVEVKIICGVDVGGDAFFGSTSKIGENEKTGIRNILLDPDEMTNLYNHIEDVKMKMFTIDDINKSNLIARSLSLPKKHFPFLCSSLKRNTKCKPLVRVSELNE